MTSNRQRQNTQKKGTTACGCLKTHVNPLGTLVWPILRNTTPLASRVSRLNPCRFTLPCVVSYNSVPFHAVVPLHPYNSEEAKHTEPGGGQQLQQNRTQHKRRHPYASSDTQVLRHPSLIGAKGTTARSHAISFTSSHFVRKHVKTTARPVFFSPSGPSSLLRPTRYPTTHHTIPGTRVLYYYCSGRIPL